jgi:hypothetical protein
MTATPEYYLEIEGTPTQLGHAHGEAFRGVINTAVSQWQDELAEAVEMPFSQLLQQFNEASGYIGAIQRLTPHLLEEVEAIAVGAAMDAELIYAWQLVDEILDFCIEYQYMEKCTLVGAYEQGPGLAPVVGKTQDLPHSYIGAHALIRTRYANSDVDIFNSTIAGIICQDGMSRHLAMCCNHVGQLERNALGLPVTYVARHMLETCKDTDQAHTALSKISHASGMNYGIADSQRTRSFEVSSDHTEEFLPAPELKRLWHTNHPLVNDHYCRDIAMWNRLTDQEAARTHARCEFVEREARKAHVPITVTRIQEILSSREVPVSSHAEDDFPTINSVIMEMTDQPTLYFAPGPPSKCEYEAFQLD